MLKYDCPKCGKSFCGNIIKHLLTCFYCDEPIKPQFVSEANDI